MAAKEPFVHDLIEGEYDGALVETIPEGDGKVRPVIRTMATSLLQSIFPFLISKREYPYVLDKEKDMKKVSVPGSHDRVFLLPNSDIDGKKRHQTIWAQLSKEQQQQVEKLQEELETVKKEKATLKKELKQKTDEEEEQKKRGSSGSSTGLVCRSCGETSSERSWKRNDMTCPKCQAPRSAPTRR